MKQKTLQVSVYWLLNHMIHNFHKVRFIETNNEPSDEPYFICSWNDDYFNSHKEEIYNRIVSFISVCENVIKVYVKPKEK